jgi:hypothetical protein
VPRDGRAARQLGGERARKGEEVCVRHRVLGGAQRDQRLDRVAQPRVGRAQPVGLVREPAAVAAGAAAGGRADGRGVEREAQHRGHVEVALLHGGLDVAGQRGVLSRRALRRGRGAGAQGTVIG